MKRAQPPNASSSWSERRFDPVDFPPGNNTPFGEIYRALFAQYQGWARKRWGIDDELLQECFNESLLIFRRKAWDGSLANYTGRQINTVLFSFAANVIRNRLKRDQQHRDRFEQLDEEADEMEGEMGFVVERELQEGIFAEPDSPRLAQLKRAMQELTDRCRQLLTLRIVHGVSIPEIAAQLGMSTANSAKTAKNKCLNRLRQLMNP